MAGNMVATANNRSRPVASLPGKLKNALISCAIIVFFVSIIWAYYARLVNAQRENIIGRGEMASLNSVNQVEQYLADCISALKITAFAIDQMMAAGRSNQEILKFMGGQSAAITNTVFPDTTGLYALVNGEYLDDIWTPEPGYEPTKRPWYVQAMQCPEEITWIDPYCDANTGQIVMTLVKRLSDGKSVVAMDVNLHKLKQITNEAVRAGNLSYAVILDSHNQLVAHAIAPTLDDAHAAGKKNLLSFDAPGQQRNGSASVPADDDLLLTDLTLNPEWKQIITAARKAIKGQGAGQAGAPGAVTGANAGPEHDRTRFEYSLSTTHSGSYLVYAKIEANGWLCLAVKDATSSYRPLKQLLAGTIAVVVAMALILFYIMDKSNRRYQRAAKLNRQLSAIANSYCTLVDIDVPNDQCVLMTTRVPKIAAVFGNGTAKTSVVMANLLERFVDPDSRPAMRKFYDLRGLKEHLAGAQTIAQEFINGDGVWRRGRFVVSKYDDDGGLDHVLWITEDIDLEKRRREQLIDMSERAIAASEAKSAFLSNMSHEIRTPINAVLGMNEMILRECDDANVLAYADTIKSAGNTLLGLINDILDFSKIESGKMKIIPVDYDLSSVINDLVSMIQTRADAKGLSLRLGFDHNLPKWLNGDEVRLKQVITNILTNAVKYTEKGEISFTIGFERHDADSDSVLLNVAVQDTGIGIKEEDMKKLFSKFERIDEQRNRHIEGTGLGMSITTSLLALMGSRLKVNSVYGVGSMFYFAIRQKVVKWEPLGDYGAAYNELLKGRKRYHERFTAPDAVVLMIDDNPMNLMVFQSLLKQTKVRVDLASDGPEGLRLTHDKKYDMIFLDHMMPGMDGIQALHALRSQVSNPNLRTPVICLTANAISGAREQYLSEGFDDYLTKPIDSAKLEETLMTFLPPEKVVPPSPGDPAVAAAPAPSPAGEGEEIPGGLAPLGACGIDVAAGLKNSGSLGAYLPLLRIFHDSMGETAAAIAGFYAAGDVKNYVIKVHALKSSARLIGAAAFGEVAQLLENAGKAGDLGYIRAHHEGFMEAYRQFREPLERALGVGAPSERQEADATLMAEAFAAVRAGAEDMDGDRLDDVFQEMAAFRPPPAEAELWERLRDAAGRYDYAEVARLLDEAGK